MFNNGNVKWRAMDNTLVSIVVPIYNMGKYLNRCLNSIKYQSHSNIEIILVDDGSIDNSTEIAKKFEKEDSRFKYFRKENGGLSSARNYGINKSSGEFISFIDADDFIDKDYVAVLLDGFVNLVDIVIADYAIYDEKKGECYRHEGEKIKNFSCKTITEKENIVSRLLNHGSFYMPVWKNMYRVSLIKGNSIGFVSERIVYAEDQVFNLQAYYKANEIKVISNIVCYHQIVAESLSQGYRKNMFAMTQARYSYICNYLYDNNKFGMLKIYKDRFADTVIDTMIMMCKCPLSEASKNIDNIINDCDVKDAFKKNTIDLKASYKTIYFFTKLSHNHFVIVVLIKMMMIINKLLRAFQHKDREYLRR